MLSHGDLPIKLWRSQLIIGSSIIRDIDQGKLQDTDVICIPGGTIDTVKQRISSLDHKYEHITLVVGGNDCDVKPAVPPKSVVDSYTDLIDSAKGKANYVNVSSICPRLKCEIAQDTIESANAGLQVACSEKADVSYMDNTPSFKLADGSLNDGYYLADMVFISPVPPQTNIARNLKLRIKDNVE